MLDDKIILGIMLKANSSASHLHMPQLFQVFYPSVGNSKPEYLFGWFRHILISLGLKYLLWVLYLSIMVDELQRL